MLLLKPNQKGRTRLGVEVGRRIGGAVKRNRIKRIVREFFRMRHPQLPPGWDLVVRPRKDVAHFALKDVDRELWEAIGHLWDESRSAQGSAAPH